MNYKLQEDKDRDVCIFILGTLPLLGRNSKITSQVAGRQWQMSGLISTHRPVVTFQADNYKDKLHNNRMLVIKQIEISFVMFLV
jgi:hypothetical protein